jgi:hypothetical protein
LRARTVRTQIMHKYQLKCNKNYTCSICLLKFYIICSLNVTQKIIKIYKFILDKNSVVIMAFLNLYDINNVKKILTNTLTRNFNLLNFCGIYSLISTCKITTIYKCYFKQCIPMNCIIIFSSLSPKDMYSVETQKH